MHTKQTIPVDEVAHHPQDPAEAEHATKDEEAGLQAAAADSMVEEGGW